MDGMLLKNMVFVVALLSVSVVRSDDAIRHDAPAELCQDPRIPLIQNWNLHDIRQRCQKDHGYTAEQLDAYEREFKRYITLVVLHPTISFEMFSKEVDALWHTFILFTKQYTKFCTNVADRYIHHSPHTQEHWPTAGQIEESRLAFLTKYYETFQENPPTDIWRLEKCCDRKPICGCKIQCQSNCGSDCD